jgi:hypothetical protein
MHLTKIFYEVDEFCKQFEQQFERKLLTDGQDKRDRHFKLSLSEIMTIVIYFHESGYKTFKDYYEKHVLVHMQCDFHHLVSYNRFLELKQKAFLPLLIFLQLNVLRPCTGISYIDSFPLKVCHVKRASAHKTFRGMAQKGKTSVGWFYGFKLHLVINHLGEITAFCITPGNIADNNENVLIKLTKKLFGKLFGDRGYLVNEELFKKLYLHGVRLFTKIRRNMKNKLLAVEDKLLLRKRGVIESVGSILKESASIEHTRHRSLSGFLSYVLAALVAYGFREKKPSIAKNSKVAGIIC